MPQKKPTYKGSTDTNHWYVKVNRRSRYVFRMIVKICRYGKETYQYQAHNRPKNVNQIFHTNTLAYKSSLSNNIFTEQKSYGPDNEVLASTYCFWTPDIRNALLKIIFDNAAKCDSIVIWIQSLIC